MENSLKKFFEENPKIAIAFSGGVDSAYLLYTAKKYAKEVKAYYVKSAFQPQFELDDAVRLSKELNAEMKIINVDILADKSVVENPKNRCYYCKTRIFTTIISEAKKDGYTVLLDGTNASDDFDDRPGMVALQELSVLSPLRICGLTKSRIREMSKEAGLFTWDKPAYACLATRIPTGQLIEKEMLERTERAEGYLASLGFSDIRVRNFENSAKIQIRESQIPLMLKHRQEIAEQLKKDYDSVMLDLEVRGE